MSVADAMRQMTMTQFYKSNSVASAASVASTPSPVLQAHIFYVRPGFLYFVINGMAYFLNLTTSKKVELGPVELSRTSSLKPVNIDATSSFVTPSVKKNERVKRDLVVNLENDDEVLGCTSRKKNKRSKSPTACKKVVPAKLIVNAGDEIVGLSKAATHCNEIHPPRKRTA
jgi:hypothetical protein